MGNHPRQESKDEASLLTTRTRNSELWFVNNPGLEDAILGYAARYATRREVKLYALAIPGNHIQGVALFPNMNRADFMRDFNSAVARAVPRYCPTFPGGGLFERRFSAEILPANYDVEWYFFYTVLQAVHHGQAQRLSDYEGYNCFHDAIWGIERKYTVTHLKEYNRAKKRDPSTSIREFQEIVVLKYERLPGYEHLSQKEYAELMMLKLEKRRLETIAKRLAKGLGFATKEIRLSTIPGSRPRTTKTSTRTSHRPRVLCSDPELRAERVARYWDTHFAYKAASKRYRSGERDVEFPPGTYKPYLFNPYPPPPSTCVQL